MAAAQLSSLRQQAAAPLSTNASRARRRNCLTNDWCSPELPWCRALATSSSSSRSGRPRSGTAASANAAANAANAEPAAPAAAAAAAPAPNPASWRDEVAAACADPYVLQRLTLKGRPTAAGSDGEAQEQEEQGGGGGGAAAAAAAMPYRQATVRPVSLRGRPRVQVTLLTARQDLTRNYAPGEEARAAVRALLDLPWRSAALTTTLEGGGGQGGGGVGGLDVQVSRRGKELVTRRRGARGPGPVREEAGGGRSADGEQAGAAAAAAAAAAGAAAAPSPSPPLLILPPHDRPKALPLPPDEPDPFLQRLGLQGADGRARADGRRKLAQVNALLRLMDATGAMEGEEDEEGAEEGAEEGEGRREGSAGREVHVLDAGCGASVLTLGVYRHLQKKAQAREAKARARKAGATPAADADSVADAPRGRVWLTGVDTNAALMRRSAEAAGELLDPSDPPAAFLAMPIRDYGRNSWGEEGAAAAEGEGASLPRPPPDLVLALHACDAATDEALALAVRSRARLALAVPCCMVSLHRGYQAAVKGAAAAASAGPAAAGPDGGGGELRAAVARAAGPRGGRSKGGGGLADAAATNPPPPPPAEAPLAALLRHGILKQRMLDLTTDALRAALLRCLGYSADAVEFVSTEHTPRNLLLRSALPRRLRRAAAEARAAGLPPPPLPIDRAAVREYKAMRAFFGGAAPPLEAMLERDGQLPKGWLADET